MNQVIATPSPDSKKKQYRFSKRGDSGGCNFDPERGTFQSYSTNVGERKIGDKPFIFLYKGPINQQGPRTTVLAAGRLQTSAAFKIYLGDPKSDYSDYNKSLAWEAMDIERPESTWSLDFPDYDLRREFVWKKTKHIAVDGVDKPSRLLARNWKLTSKNDPDDILAVFTGDSGFSRGRGILQINVDWGAHFEHMVLMTLVCQFLKHKQPSRQGNGVFVPPPPMGSAF
ncbi:unnamed protein product [Clonostachys rosea f. rosea IK726]|jgi:hypothetical protein|uniref:Uncharacterized protein n=1 Tax=Clonostachys rosea f. rosea IK726 TaxID=1349383 RepID=A0ACA9TQB5_BIOOC|nr:unnamed protein product [Clonostachys rosea f. rosea IK726]